MNILIGIIVVALTSVLSWILSKVKIHATLHKYKIIAETAEKNNNQLVGINKNLNQELESLKISKHSLELNSQKIATQLEGEKSITSSLKKEIEKTYHDFQIQSRERESAEKNITHLKTLLEEQHKHNIEAQEQQSQNKLAMKDEFKVLANEILNTSGKVFEERHNERLNTLLNPFKVELGDFKLKVEEARKEDSLGRAALKQQLESLQTLNTKINDEAKNLTKVLKGDKKFQGNWGEMQVEKILEFSGLIANHEYLREPNFKDDEGANKRPDFIVKLPEDKHLIIDSKVSLVDYCNYVNAESEVEKEKALKNHIQCVRNHIRQLNSKNYPALQGMNGPDFVFMFMPVEIAYMLAFQKAPELYKEGYEDRIVVVSPSTLLASLRTVASLWTIECQNENGRKLADRAQKVYDKLRVFVKKMEKIDSQMTTLRKTYDDALNTLKKGNGNLINQAQQFLKLGVRVNKELPRHTLETSDLVCDIKTDSRRIINE